jgi:hypothetical protein
VRVREWWVTVWSSPVSAVYLDVDVHGLAMLAVLRDEFFRGDLSLAAEIRLQDQRGGLDLVSRRRLQLEVPSKPTRETGAGERPRERRRVDPRSLLRVLEGPGRRPAPPDAS